MKVHVLIWGDLFNMRCRLLFENVSWATACVSWRPDGYSSEFERILIATQQLGIASTWATKSMIKQKSADDIVAKCPS